MKNYLLLFLCGLGCWFCTAPVATAGTVNFTNPPSEKTSELPIEKGKAKTKKRHKKRAKKKGPKRQKVFGVGKIISGSLLLALSIVFIVLAVIFFLLAARSAPGSSSLIVGYALGGAFAFIALALFIPGLINLIVGIKRASRS